MGFATAVTVASMAASAVQAKKQRDAAKKAAAAQEGAMNEATEEQRRQYEEKKALYGPIEEKLVAEANSDIPLAYTRQAQEIEKQVSEAQRSMMGRPYGSGVLRSTQENLLLREAEAKAGAYGSALDQQRAMRMQLTQFNPSNQLGAQYADAMNKKSIALSDMYSKQRQQAEAAEGAAWQNVASGAFSVAGDIDKYMRKKDEGNIPKRDPGPNPGNPNPGNPNPGNPNPGNPNPGNPNPSNPNPSNPNTGGGGGSSQYSGDYGTDSGYNPDGTLKERDKKWDNFDINPYSSIYKKSTKNKKNKY